MVIYAVSPPVYSAHELLFSCDMSNLTNSIKSLYAHITEEEAILAEGNLIGFFKTLERIEERISIENKAQTMKQESNELQNENIRSAN